MAHNFEFLHVPFWCALLPQPGGEVVLFTWTKPISLSFASGPTRRPRGKHLPGARMLAPKQAITRQPVETDQSQAFKFFSNLISYLRILGVYEIWLLLQTEFEELLTRNHEKSVSSLYFRYSEHLFRDALS